MPHNSISSTPHRLHAASRKLVEVEAQAVDGIVAAQDAGGFSQLHKGGWIGGGGNSAARRL